MSMMIMLMSPWPPTPVCFPHTMTNTPTLYSCTYVCTHAREHTDTLFFNKHDQRFSLASTRMGAELSLSKGRPMHVIVDWDESLVLWIFQRGKWGNRELGLWSATETSPLHSHLSKAEEGLIKQLRVVSLTHRLNLSPTHTTTSCHLNLSTEGSTKPNKAGPCGNLLPAHLPVSSSKPE